MLKISLIVVNDKQKGDIEKKEKGKENIPKMDEDIKTSIGINKCYHGWCEVAFRHLHAHVFFSQINTANFIMPRNASWFVINSHTNAKGHFIIHIDLHVLLSVFI